MAADGVTTDTGPVETGSLRVLSGAASRYGLALYNLASERGELDQVVEQMGALGRLIDASPELRRLLSSPLVDVVAGRNALLAVLDREGFGKTVHDFAGVVAGNRRLALLPAIVAAFAALVAEKRGVVTASVTTAHPLTDLQEQQLRARLIEAGYGRVEIVRHVDPALLGGMVVRIGARLYDTSLRSRLQRLQYAMKGAA